MSQHETAPIIYLLGIGVPAIATIIVAWITTRKGKGAHDIAEPFKPAESGEHAHTRDVVKAGFRALDRRLDAMDAARGMIRQQEQIGLSEDAVATRKKGRKP